MNEQSLSKKVTFKTFSNLTVTFICQLPKSYDLIWPLFAVSNDFMLFASGLWVFGPNHKPSPFLSFFLNCINLSRSITGGRSGAPEVGELGRDQPTGRWGIITMTPSSDPNSLRAHLSWSPPPQLGQHWATPFCAQPRPAQGAERQSHGSCRSASHPLVILWTWNQAPL